MEKELQNWHTDFSGQNKQHRESFHSNNALNYPLDQSIEKEMLILIALTPPLEKNFF